MTNASSSYPDRRWDLARIESTWFGLEDHGCLTFSLGFNYGGSAQGIGHLIVATKSGVGENSVRLIFKILEVFCFDDYTKLKGKALWVWHDFAGVYGMRQLEPDGGKEIVFDDILKAGAVTHA